jgi:hypothetical protein
VDSPHNWSGVVKVQLGEIVQRVELRNQAYDDDFVVPLSCSAGGPQKLKSPLIAMKARLGVTPRFGY